MHQSVPAAPIPPPPFPGQLRGICAPCQSRGWGISKFGAAWGSGIRLPWGYPWAFDTHVVSDLKSKQAGFYRKGQAVRRRLARPSKLRTGRTLACVAGVSIAKKASNGRKTLMKHLLRRLDELVEVFSILCISSLLIKAQLELSGTINENRRT